MNPLAPIAQMKIIVHNIAQINERDDESLPFKVELEMVLPAFTKPLPIVRYGCERLVLRFSNYEGVQHLLNDRPVGEDPFGFHVSIQNHPRLKKLVVTGPMGEMLCLEPRRNMAS